MIDATDSCPGCKAPWYPAHGAFGCGYPSADCGAMVEEDERIAATEAEFLALQADEAAFVEMLTRFLMEGCPLVDVAPLDALEAEQDARRERFFGAAS